jgi:tetratricopeptide (TPR) repeat protein
MDEGRLEDAARYAEAQLEGSEPNAFWLTQKAKARVRSSDYDVALQAGRRALELEPNNLYAVAVTADALLGKRLYQDALPYYEELLPSSRLSRSGRRGVLECLSGMGQWERVLERLAEWRVSQEQALAWKVRALKALDRRSEALETCERWLELKPDFPAALWERTELEIQRDGLEAVRQKMGRTARIRSLPQVYREIYASLCRRAGQTEEAIKTYEQITATGAQTRIQKKQVFAMARNGKEREALPLLEELLRKEPKDIYLHSSYSAACKRIGEVERAIDFYNELLGLYPDEKGLYGKIKTLRRELEARQ